MGHTRFFLAAGLYAIGWVQILRIRTASRGPMVATSGLLGNLVAGIRYMYTQPLMRSLILVTLCHCALTMAYESAFPLVARTQLGLHAAKDLFAGPASLMIGLGAGAVLGCNFSRSYWIPGSFETSSSMSEPSNALPRFRTL